MRELKHGTMAVACAASVALASLALVLCSAWVLRSASLVQSLALTAMSVLGSAVIALVEFIPSTFADSPAATGHRARRVQQYLAARAGSRQHDESGATLELHTGND